MKKKRDQTGAVLIVSLIILLLMTIIGITAMQTTTMEERMAGNLRDRNLALQAAEAALRDGENWLASQVVRPNTADDGSQTVWTRGAPVNQDDADASNDIDFFAVDWGADGVEYGTLANTTGNPSVPGVAAEPRFVIEEYSFIPDDSDPMTRAKGIGVYYYRVTARAVGGSDVSESYLQSFVAKRFN